MGCRLADVETQKPLELCSQIVLPLRGMEIWSSGGMLRAWGRCLKRGLEVRCRRADSGGICLKSPGGLEMRRKPRDMEVWSSGDALQACRRLRSGGVLRV